MDTIYDLEVSKEDEMLLRNNWKLISTCQFINLFKNVLKIKDAVTPYDLEQSLLRPQHDPLCAELMSRLLQKRNFKRGAGDDTIVSNFKQDNFQCLDYDTWNIMLAKKFAMMYKNYRKFAIKYLGKDPLLEVEQEQGHSQMQLDQLLNEKPQHEELKQDPLERPEMEETKGEPQQLKEEQTEQQQHNDDMSHSQEEHKANTTVVIPRERITRSRAAKMNGGNQNETSHQSDKQTKGNKKGKKGEDKGSQQSNNEQQPMIIEQVWSSDVRENLLKQLSDENLTVRFSFEEVAGYGQQNQWKADSLQIIKLFNEELNGQDPFYIQGQDWNVQQKDDQSNYWSNFVDTDNFDDFDELQFQMGQFGSKGSQLEVLFKRFHEIPSKNRIDILYFLCQNKLDTEQPEFMQEVQTLQGIKPSKSENETGQPLKMSEELKQWLEPINMGLLKPLGQITEQPKQEGNQDEVIIPLIPGKYYYFPFFSDTRIYRQSFDNTVFELFIEDYEQIQFFLNSLRTHEDIEECFNLLEKLTKYTEHLKKFADEMKWKEASKVRKLKSQIRSRRLQDLSRKKLQFEGRSNQLQTDFLHHTQGTVMTRKQVDNIKSKINKSGALPEESKKRETRERGSVMAKYQEQQKEKYEKEKLDRQKRLEKRMRIKERITGGLGKRKRRRGADSEDEDDYDDEYDDEENGDANKRQKGDDEPEQVEEEAPLEYDILLNGHLLNIVQRDQIDLSKIMNDTMVIKGNWKLSIEERAEGFIYKKVGPPSQEDLLTELFCDNPNDRITPTSNDIIMADPNVQEILQKFAACQGLYEGYFLYNEEEVKETISFILRKPQQNTKKQHLYDFCGYGENTSMGPFTMEGTIQLFPFDKLQEKDGGKNFKKTKMAKFNLQKYYTKKYLEELVEEARQDREDINNPQQKQQYHEQITQIKIRTQNIPENNPHTNQIQPHIYSQSSHTSYRSNDFPAQQNFPKFPAMNLSMGGQLPGLNFVQDQLSQMLHSQQSLQHSQTYDQQHSLLDQTPQQQLLSQLIQKTQQPPLFQPHMMNQLMQSTTPFGLGQPLSEIQRLAAQSQMGLQQPSSMINPTGQMLENQGTSQLNILSEIQRMQQHMHQNVGLPQQLIQPGLMDLGQLQMNQQQQMLGMNSQIQGQQQVNPNIFGIGGNLLNNNIMPGNNQNQ